MDRVIIIGGGIAGLSVCWALAKRGRRVLLVERESRLGQGSSGVNAGILRVSVPERINVVLALRSLTLGRELLGNDYVDAIGGLFPCEDASTRAAILDAASDAGVVPARPDQLPNWLAFRDRPTLWSPTDGIINVPAVLTALESASRRLGAEIRTRAEVTSVEFTNGCVSGVVLDGEIHAASSVVDCTGAWSPTLPGAPPLVGVKPHRRHIFVLERMPAVDVRHVIWDLTDGVYLRPSPDVVMTCPCDETPSAAALNCETDPAAPELLRKKLRRWAPAFAESPIVRWWAGLRPLTDDHRFVIGEDPAFPGLFRVGGFGGHGVTAGLAAGELAAAALDGQDVRELTELRPTRFAQKSAL